jgi:hypothetical protein
MMIDFNEAPQQLWGRVGRLPWTAAALSAKTEVGRGEVALACTASYCGVLWQRIQGSSVWPNYR